MDSSNKQYQYEVFSEIIIHELQCSSPVDESVVIHVNKQETEELVQDSNP